MNICESLVATARLFPEKEAIVFEGSRLSYADIDMRSLAAAGRLVEIGVQRGDRVAIMLPNVPAFAVWYYAALRIGAIAVSVSHRLAPSEVAFVISDCEATAFVTLPETMHRVTSERSDELGTPLTTSEFGDLCDGRPLQVADAANGSWVEAEPDEAALILYTSGTTGFPKGATLSHRNVRSNVCAFNHLCNMQPEDRILLAVPLFHCFGQNALLNSGLNVGATLVMQRNFDLGESKRLIAEEKVTQLYGVPTMFHLIHERCEPADLATINYCFSAAATLPLQVAQRWQAKFGMPIYEGYGLTETSPFASYNHRLKFVQGSIGTPIDAVEMKIVDPETGVATPPGQLGEIAIRGPNVMLGYWNRPEDTAAAIRDGWFHSGDIGRIDENGFFYIVDRVKDMITVGGLKVYPAEVERVLLDHPWVADVAVVGLPDEVFGEHVAAFVVPTSGSASTNRDIVAAIKQHGQEHLANYKVPRHIALVVELPRNPAGKVLKKDLRQSPPEAAPAGSVSTVPRASDGSPSKTPRADSATPPTLRKQLEATHAARRQDLANTYLQQLVQRIGGCEELPRAEDRFLESGLDSLMIVEIASQLQIEVGAEIDLPATLVFDYPRICDLGAFLVDTLSENKTAVGAAKADAAVSRESRADDFTDRGLRDKRLPLNEEEVLAALIKEIED